MVTGTLQQIPIGEIHESKWNTRQQYDEAKLAELAATIVKVGILDPLLVRPVKGHFEIASGHRRYRAALQLKLETLPCVVSKMDDEEFIEILTIGNLQRQDVHPLEEATGYERLAAPPYRLTPAQIAERVGRTEAWIRDTLKLGGLVSAIKALFWLGTISRSHAVVLGRLTPKEQTQVLGTAAQEYRDGGLLEPQGVLYSDGEKSSPYKAHSVRELEDYIKRHVRFDAQAADPFLFPETVQSVTTAVEAKLKIVEITDEYLAHDDVRSAGSARVFGSQAWKRADGEASSKACEYAVLGVFASGQHRGKSMEVCTRKDKCTVHWGKEIRAREKGRKAAGSSGSSTASRKESSLENRWEKQEAERKAKKEAWEKAVPAILEQAAAIVRTMPIKANSDLGTFLCKAIDYHGGDKEAIATIKRGTTAEDLIRHLAYIALYENANGYGAHEEFPKAAKWLGLDIPAIVKLANLAEEKKPAPAKKGKKAKAA